MKSSEQKVILVIGATSKRGQETALHYAKSDPSSHLILCDEDLKSLEVLDKKLDHLQVSTLLVPLNYADLTLIDSLAKQLFDKFQKLDILINCHEFHGDRMPIAQASSDLIQQSFQANFFLNWKLIQAFDPLLERSESGEILFLLTPANENSSAYQGVFNSSKRAFEELIRTYREEKRNSGIRIGVKECVDSAVLSSANGL